MSLPIFPDVRKVFDQMSPEAQDLYIERIKELNQLKQEVVKLKAFRLAIYEVFNDSEMDLLIIDTKAKFGNKRFATTPHKVLKYAHSRYESALTELEEE